MIWSPSSFLSKYQPPSGAAHQAVYCWQPCLSGCRSSSLERSARGRRLIVIIADFPSSIKNSSFSTFIPSPDFWPLDWHRYSGLCSNVCYLGHSTNLCLLTYLLIYLLIFNFPISSPNVLFNVFFNLSLSRWLWGVHLINHDYKTRTPERICLGEYPEADLGMFSMFGRTGVPQKGASQKDIHRIACVSSTFQWFNSLLWHLMAFLWRLSVKHISITPSLTYSLLQKGWPQTARQLLLQ